MANYLVIKGNNNAKRSYTIASTYTGKPYLKVSNGYLDLTSNTAGNSMALNVKVNNKNYKVLQTSTYNTTEPYNVQTTTSVASSYKSTYQAFNATYRTTHYSYSASATLDGSYPEPGCGHASYTWGFFDIRGTDDYDFRRLDSYATSEWRTNYYQTVQGSYYNTSKSVYTTGQANTVITKSRNKTVTYTYN